MVTTRMLWQLFIYVLYLGRAPQLPEVTTIINWSNVIIHFFHDGSDIIGKDIETAFAFHVSFVTEKFSFFDIISGCNKGICQKN